MIPQTIPPEVIKRAELLKKGIWTPPPAQADQKRVGNQKLAQQKLAELKGQAPSPGN